MNSTSSPGCCSAALVSSSSRRTSASTIRELGAAVIVEADAKGAAAQRRHHRDVAWPDAELPVGPGERDPVGLAREDLPLGTDDGDVQVDLAVRQLLDE